MLHGMILFFIAQVISMQNGNTHAFHLPYSLQQFTVPSFLRWLLTFGISDGADVITCALLSRMQALPSCHSFALQTSGNSPL